MHDRSALVRGYVAGPKVMKRIEDSLGKVAGITEVKNEIQELPRIYCQTLELYAPYWTANRDAGFGTAIGTRNASNAFVEGERLVVDIGTPTYKSWLYVDYRAGPRRLDRDRDLISEIFWLRILEREGAEDDPKKATQSFISLQGEGSTGSAEG